MYQKAQLKSTESKLCRNSYGLKILYIGPEDRRSGVPLENPYDRTGITLKII